MADEVAPVVTPAPEVPVVDPVRTEIDAMATEYGYSPTDFAAFKDADSARTAIKLAIETAASRSYEQAPINEPANRFSKPAVQSEPTAQSAQTYQPIDYKALGLEEDDAAAKALKLQEQRIRANDERLATMEAKLAEQQSTQQQQASQQVRQQVDEIVSAYASPRYGTSQHRTAVQEMQVTKLIEMAGVIRRNSGGQLPLKACLNQARLLDEGTASAINTVLPAKKAANSELSQGGAPTLSEGIPKMKMTDVWSMDPAFRAKYNLPPLPGTV